MSMSGAVREKTYTDEPTEPLFAALEHIEKRGSLLWLVPDRAQRLGLMKALTKQKLVAWNPTAAKYELTTLGAQCLAEYR
jgi:hypothetical protein